MKYKIKKDKFRRTRGNFSTVCLVKCTACGSDLLIYQKDGPVHGWFKRIYADRIIELRATKMIEGKALCCNKCQSVFGIYFVYTNHGEKREAFHVDRSKVTRKILQRG